MTKKWYRRPQVWVALGIFLIALGVYLATMSPTISFWDCGEYVTTSHILGIPHQPGTPLYVLVGRTFDIFFGSPDIDKPALKTAAAVNFMSSFFSALAVMFIYLIILDVARRGDPDSGWLAHAGGIIGAIFLMLSETYWNNAIEAEVYGLAAFIIGLVTWLSLKWYDSCDEKRSNWLLYLVVYLLGLGVGFHLGSLLVYPGILILGLLAKQRRLPLFDFLLLSLGLGLFILWTLPQDRPLPIFTFITYGILFKLLIAVFLVGVFWRTMTGKVFVLVASGIFLLGLSVHLYMLIRAGLDPAINQSQPDNLETLFSVLRREQYPPMDFFKRQADLGWQIKYYYNYFIQQFYFLGDGQGVLARTGTFIGPIFLGMLGVFHGIRRARPVIWMLVVIYLINSDFLNLYLNFTDHEVRDRDYFFFAAFMFFAIFIGLGAAALLRYAAGPEGKSSAQLEDNESAAPVHIGLLPKIATGLLVIIAALPMVQPGHAKWFAHDRSENTIPYEYAWNMMAGLDRGAILFTNGDNDTFPIWYLQEVEHFRRDVTVVNLSLVNLPWYVKVMRERDPPAPMQKGLSDSWIDELRPYLIKDPETGQDRIVYVRDFVVRDIVQANARSANRRPVFFAVTIPHDNMADYVPYLQMEGLAYRLLYEPSTDNLPIVDSERLLENMFGVYDYTGLMDGDTESRLMHYRELAGWQSDAVAGDEIDFGPVHEMPFAQILDEVGYERTDVYRDTNTQNLLGNYPAALVRAGYDYILQTYKVAAEDTAVYDKLLDKALAAIELASRFEPGMDPIVELLPIVLVEKGRPDEALAYLQSLAGEVRPVLLEDVTFKTVFSMSKIGYSNVALQWLLNRIDADPDNKFYYDLLFKVQYNLKDIAGCRSVIEKWQQRSGQADPAMIRDMEALEQEALSREQKRIEQSLEEKP